ncbi:MAG: acetylxylan esterase [Lentisphaeria bacterium]|nr:acetylxylan esterase [Lentisphaeria bacterium]
METKEEIRARMYTDESRVPVYTVPDPLCMNDGTAVRTPDEWMTKRRPELLRWFEENMYGPLPPEPEEVSFEVLSERGDALGGIALRRELRITLTGTAGRQHILNMLLYLPKDAKRSVPAFLGLDFKGNAGCSGETDLLLPPELPILPGPEGRFDGRGCQAPRWSFEQVIRRGYASAAIWYNEIFPDTPEGFPHSVYALFDTPEHLKQERPEAGAISAWAWGLSRGLDVLRKIPEIDGKKVIVHGHSRLGKTALWAAACDQRFAMAVSNCSGCGGAALSRRGFGENLAWLLYWRTYWFDPAWRKWIDRETELPVDQHELMALIAPRPLAVASADEDLHADPKGEYLSLYHGGKVWKLWGKESFTSPLPPAPGEAADTGVLHYHFRQGKHDITPWDWDKYLDFADRVL